MPDNRRQSSVKCSALQSNTAPDDAAASLSTCQSLNHLTPHRLRGGLLVPWASQAAAGVTDPRGRRTPSWGAITSAGPTSLSEKYPVSNASACIHDRRLLKRDVTVADDHPGATGQQCLGAGIPDAARGAGDRDRLAPDVVHATKLYTCQFLVGRGATWQPCQHDHRCARTGIRDDLRRANQQPT